MKPEILIVEDDLIIAQSIANDLEQEGYTISDTCESGEKAIEMVESRLPDLILMDIKLEGKLDGILTAEKILKKYRIPVIYLTDLQDRVTLDNARQTRPSNYLVKPFQTHQLLIAVDFALFNGNSDAIGNSCGFFKENKEYIKIAYADILYIKADGSYAEIHTTTGKHTLTRPLNQLLKRIPYPDLVRIQKSFCINKNHVSGIIGKMIYIKDFGIKVGETYEGVFREHFDLI